MAGWQVKWDIDVPKHDESAGANATAVVRGEWFREGNLRREAQCAGRQCRDTAHLLQSTPVDRPRLETNTAAAVQPCDDNDAQPASQYTQPVGNDLGVEDEDEDDEDYDPSADEELAGDHVFDATIEGDELLKQKQPYGPFRTTEDKFTQQDGTSVHVDWEYIGQGEEELIRAGLPWTLSGEGWSDSADPTKLGSEDYNVDMNTSVTEFEQFIMFYPGALDGALEHVETLNEIATSRDTTGKWKNISIFDWFAFLSILLARTRYADVPLDSLWKPSGEFAPYFNNPDFNVAMNKSQFDIIRRYAHCAFDGGKVSDPWNPFRGFVDQYNEHMKAFIQLGRYYIHDESMGPWKPRADKYGGLPHLSYIQRKPMPFRRSRSN
eukprot:COSAG01_NODE_2130_length_8363_cov_5.120523_5_plen_379_part_00